MINFIYNFINKVWITGGTGANWKIDLFEFIKQWWLHFIIILSYEHYKGLSRSSYSRGFFEKTP